MRIGADDPADQTFAGVKVAVIPGGSPAAERDTGDEKPPDGVTETGAYAFCRWTIATVDDVAIWNDPTGVDAAPQEFTSMAASTEPRPVAGSYPGPAE
jgi:hypothetical protein